MLTKEKIDKIVNAPATGEERIIKVVYQNKGVANLDTIHKETFYSKEQIRAICKDSFYLIKENQLVKLSYKGKESPYLFAIPEKADSLQGFVFSKLVENYALNFQDTVSKVIDFCKAKNLNYIAYIQNRNCYDTIRKDVTKYLNVFLSRRDNWSKISIETLNHWKKKHTIK